MVKVLLSLSSYYADGGAGVTLVLETGSFGWDEHSLVGDFAEASVINNNESHPVNGVTKNIKKASEVNSVVFDLFFAAGGQGAIFDFPEARDLPHFENIKTKNGEYFIKGKNLTGFTDAGEKLLKVDHIMKTKNLNTPKEGSIHSGANYIDPKDPCDSFIKTDRKLVIGVNPAYATETAEKASAAYYNSGSLIKYLIH